MKRLIIVTLLAWFLINHNSPAKAQRAFKCVDENGTISYQRKPCQKNDSSLLEEKGITDNESYQESLIVVSDQLQKYTISIMGFNWWQASIHKVNEKLLQVKFKDPTKDSPLVLMVDFIIPSKKSAFSPKDLEDLLVKKSRQVLSQSVETRPTFINIRTQGVLGLYSSFKDAKLAEQQTIPDGQYRFNTQGIMYTQGLLINFTLLSNDLGSDNHRYAMHFITKGVTIKKD